MPRVAVLPSVVLAAVLLAGCGEKDEGGVTTTNPRVGGPSEEGQPQECAGIPAMSGPSSSYRDGAAPVASDGDELVIRLRFLRVEGRDCRTVPGVTAEIWHTGSSGYDPVLWRTALPVGDDGTVIYRTVRPSAVEGTPHVHVRVADFDERAYEWVFGVPQDGEETLEMQLLLIYVTETNPPPGVETPGV